MEEWLRNRKLYYRFDKVKPGGLRWLDVVFSEDTVARAGKRGMRREIGFEVLKR
jgi:hypothetical protein